MLAHDLHFFVNPDRSFYLQAARSVGVPIILDAGGVDAPIPPELLNVVDIFSPNESELARLTGMSTRTFEQISHAVVKCHDMVSDFFCNA